LPPLPPRTAATDARERVSPVRERRRKAGTHRMTRLLAVYRNELAAYFRSPIAYFVVAVFLVGTGYFFLYNVFFSGEATMAATFQNMGVLLLLLIPLMSMRPVAAQLRAGT